MLECPKDEKAIFLAALEQATPDEREAYLQGACGDDRELLKRLKVLLSVHEQSQGPLDVTSPGAAIAATINEAITDRPGTVIGPYKLLEQIGEGGFGIVFMAEQQGPIRRKVALKLIKPGMDSKQVIARFEAERQALAIMDHPHIAKVFDGGTTASGRPYFVMELEKGVPITEFCDQSQLTPRQRLELFLPVCQAVQHAHQKGIIHRDLKPSNVLVSRHDTTPVVKVIDFGVAKALGQGLTDKTLCTGFAQIVGTPLYMSPEQAGMSDLDVDTRSDIYSLGVLLYELLTGMTPFDKERFQRAGYDEIRRIIREEDPPRPSTRISTLGQAARTVSTQRQSDPKRLSQLVRGELDWIVMKCLEKDRNHRYETANGLARDVERYLHDEPVQACPPSLRYRLGKFGRKHGRLLATAAAFAVLVITVAVVASVAAWRLSVAAWRLGEEQEATSQQLQETRKAQQQTKLELYRSLVAEARANRLSRRTGRRVHSLEILAEATRLARELQLPEDDFLELRNETIACLPLVDLRVARTWEGCPAGTVYVDFDANLESYVRVDPLKNVASVRRVADDSEVCRITDFGRSREPSLVLSPDGRFLGVEEGRLVGLQSLGGPQLKVWRVTSHGAELLLQEPGHTLRFSPDSRQVAIARKAGGISLHELPSGKQLKQWQTGPSAGRLAFHPEKRQLAVWNSAKIMVFDLETGNKLADFAHARGWDPLEWLPDGKRLATVNKDRCIYLWDAYKGKSLGRLAGHNNDGIHVASHPAGDLLASSSWDGTLRLWEVGTGRELFKTSWIGCPPHFSRDGRLLAADVADHQLRLWEVISPCGYRNLVREPHVGKTEYSRCAVSVKHRLLAVGMQDGVGLWELPSGRPVAFLASPADVAAFEPSGAVLTFGVGVQRRWPIEAVGPDGMLRVGPPQPLPFPAPAGQIATNRDGRVMGSAQARGALVWHADKGNELVKLTPQHDVRFVAVSPDGRWIATGSHSSTDVYVKVWDSRTGGHIADLPVEGSSRVGFSPDGRWLLTTGGGCRLWAAGTWREGPKIGGIGAFAFSSDSKVLAVEAGSGAVRLLDPDTGREYARLEDPNQDRAHNLAFSPDGSQLVASTNDGPAVHAWDLRAIRAELAQRALDWYLPPYPPVGEPKTAPPLRLTVVSQDRALAHVRLGQLRLNVVSEDRALAHVKLGQWAQAAGVYALLVESNPDNHWYWYRSAPLCLRTGNFEGYRRICREMLTRFGNTDELEIADRTAKTCSLAPEAVSEFAPVLKLADWAVTGTEKHRDYRWFVLVKGLAEYRAGHYDVAVDWMNRFAPRAGGWAWDATAFAVLAMAKHRLGLASGADAVGLAAEARAALGHAQAILAEKMPDPKEGRPYGGDFQDWLHPQILVHEAQKLFEKDKK
jgi:serine/threonine protein kinase/WD40 repeat protein